MQTDGKGRIIQLLLFDRCQRKEDGTMYNRYLKIFIQVADSGSFSKAAEGMYISPNAVIKQINRYEEHLGFPLFNRTNHGISLTEEGSIIYAEGKKIIRKYDKLLDEIRNKRTVPEA